MTAVSEGDTQKTGGFVWLASYPKSGNTWLRVVFTNLTRSDGGPASINALQIDPQASDRGRFDQLVGYSSSDLTHEEVDRLRPHLYRHQAATSQGTLFCKVHDALTYLPDGQPLFPFAATVGAIYLVRNPLDVCVSFASHEGERDYDVIIKRMANRGLSLGGSRDHPSPQLRQRLLSWSDHVRSWVDAPGLRVHILRYEDMHDSPMESFASAAAFAGLPSDHETVARAVAFSSIEELRRQEQADGFAEQVAPDRPFFRKGRVGAWREALSEEQAARLIADHVDVMKRFGYLTAEGKPFF